MTTRLTTIFQISIVFATLSGVAFGAMVNTLPAQGATRPRMTPPPTSSKNSAAVQKETVGAAVSPTPPANVGNWSCLLFAVERYDPTTQNLPPLHGCHNDMAAARSEWFQRIGIPESRITFLHDHTDVQETLPTKDNFMRTLNDMVNSADPNGTLVVMVSSHGIAKDGKSYICPIDSTEDSQSLIDVASLIDRLKSARAGKKLLLIDACRTVGEAETSEDFMREFAAISKSIFETKNGANGGLAVVSSCSVEQEAHEMIVDGKPRGVFMKYFLEGLSGPADYMGVIDGNITLSEAYSYAFAQTSKYVYLCREGKQQTPELFREAGLTKFTLAQSEPARKQPNETNMQFLLRQSMALATKGNLSLVIDILNHIISCEPNNHVAYACRAGSFLSRADYQQAMNDFTYLGRTLDLYARPSPTERNTPIRIRSDKDVKASTVSYKISSQSAPISAELKPGQKVSIGNIDGSWLYVVRIDDDATQSGIGWIHKDNVVWSQDNIEQYRPQTAIYTPPAQTFNRAQGPGTGGGTSRGSSMQRMPGRGSI